jgi:SAM-dependent methyltransferase
MSQASGITERYGEVIFDHARDDEQRRLEGITRTYDPITQKCLSGLGVSPGWRCLEVGAGTGTIAHWIAERVAPTQVIAVDRSTKLIPDAPNLHVIQADALSSELPAELAPGSFDLIHTRFLLMHLPERKRLLARLASWLAPGGWLVAGESIDFTTRTSPHIAYGDTFAAMWAALHDTIGTDITWVRRYPELFAGLGLIDTGMEVFLPSAHAGAPISDFWKITWAQSRDRILATGLVDEAGFGHALALFDDPGFAEISPGMITAWARRPSNLA